MTIQEFIQKFKEDRVANSKVAPDAVSVYLKKELEVKDYAPFIEKRELCEKVLNASNTKNNNGLVEVDSVTRYIVFTISVIMKYTNLEFSSGLDAEFDSLDEYDMLCQSGLLNPILSVIGEEYASCNNMLNMMMEDILTNNNNVENVLGTASNRLLESIDKVVDALANKIDELELDLDQIDIDKYKGLLDLLPLK